MKNRNSLPLLVKSTIAAGLLVQSAFADVNGNNSMVESCGIRTGDRVNCSSGAGCGMSGSGSTTIRAGDRQLDVSLTENGQVRISWDADLLENATLQVSDNYADWAEVPNARNPFFTPINNEVATYYRVVYDLSGGTRNTPPEDFGNKRIYGDTDGDGVNDRGVFGIDDEPGPDVLWVDKNGDGLVDEDELTPIAAVHDTLKAVISNLKTVDGGSVPVPLEWLDDILDGFEVAAGNDQRWAIADAVRIERIGGTGGEGDNASEKDWIQIVKLQYEGGLSGDSVPLPLEWLKDILDDLAGSAGSDGLTRWVIADAVRIERIGDSEAGGDNVTSKEWISILKQQYEGALAGNSVPVPIEWLGGVLDDLAMSSGVNAEGGWVIADALRIERISTPDAAGDVPPGSGAVYIFHRGGDNGNRSQSLHDTAMAVIRKINAAPEGGSGSGGNGNAIIVIRAAGNDPLFQMITIVPEKVERAGVDGDPPPGSIEWLDEFLKDIFGSSAGANGPGEHDTVMAVIRKFYGTGEGGAIAEMIILVNNHYAGAAGGETPLSPMFENMDSIVVLARTDNDPDLNDLIHRLLNKLWHDAIPEDDELGISFPDWLGPPGIWTTGGSSGLMAADLGFGYDTFGIRRAICVNSGLSGEDGGFHSMTWYLEHHTGFSANEGTSAMVHELAHVMQQRSGNLSTGGGEHLDARPCTICGEYTSDITGTHWNCVRYRRDHGDGLIGGDAENSQLRPSQVHVLLLSPSILTDDSGSDTIAVTVIMGGFDNHAVPASGIRDESGIRVAMQVSRQRQTLQTGGGNETLGTYGHRVFLDLGATLSNDGGGLLEYEDYWDMIVSTVSLLGYQKNMFESSEGAVSHGDSGGAVIRKGSNSVSKWTYAVWSDEGGLNLSFTSIHFPVVDDDNGASWVGYGWTLNPGSVSNSTGDGVDNEAEWSSSVSVTGRNYVGGFIGGGSFAVSHGSVYHRGMLELRNRGISISNDSDDGFWEWRSNIIQIDDSFILHTRVSLGGDSDGNRMATGDNNTANPRFLVSWGFELSVADGLGDSQKNQEILILGIMLPTSQGVSNGSDEGYSVSSSNFQILFQEHANFDTGGRNSTLADDKPHFVAWTMSSAESSWSNSSWGGGGLDLPFTSISNGSGTLIADSYVLIPSHSIADSYVLIGGGLLQGVANDTMDGIWEWRYEIEGPSSISNGSGAVILEKDVEGNWILPEVDDEVLVTFAGSVDSVITFDSNIAFQDIDGMLQADMGFGYDTYGIRMSIVLSPMFESLDSVVALSTINDGGDGAVGIILGGDGAYNEELIAVISFGMAVDGGEEGCWVTYGTQEPIWFDPCPFSSGGDGSDVKDLYFYAEKVKFYNGVKGGVVFSENIMFADFDDGTHVESIRIGMDENGTTVMLDLQDINHDGRIRVSELATMCARWSANSRWLVICPFDDNNASLSAGSQVDDMWMWRENIERGLSGIWTDGLIASVVEISIEVDVVSTTGKTWMDRNLGATILLTVSSTTDDSGSDSNEETATAIEYMLIAQLSVGLAGENDGEWIVSLQTLEDNGVDVVYLLLSDSISNDSIPIIFEGGDRIYFGVSRFVRQAQDYAGADMGSVANHSGDANSPDVLYLDISLSVACNDCDLESTIMVYPVLSVSNQSEELYGSYHFLIELSVGYPGQKVWDEIEVYDSLTANIGASVEGGFEWIIDLDFGENGTVTNATIINQEGCAAPDITTMCARWSANSDWLVICPFDDNNSSLSAGGQVDDLWKWRENIERGLSVIWTTGGSSGVWTTGGSTGIWTSGPFTSVWTTGPITGLVNSDGGQEGAPIQSAWLVLGIAASDSPIEGITGFIVEVLQVMKTKHDTAMAAINNVR